MILRPVTVLVCGYGFYTLKRKHLRRHRFLFAFAAALFALTAAHLLPLPPSMWSILSGREITADIDRVAGLGEVWRPISMVPGGTWNALYSLFAPLAVLLLAAQLEENEQYRVLLVILGLGISSGFLGLLQVIGDSTSPLYLYSVTNGGSAVGLFANRNHAAVLLACLSPMLAVYASARVTSAEEFRFKTGVALAVGVVLVPLILVTGSRAGLVIGAIGLLSIPFLYRRPQFLRAARPGRQLSPAIIASLAGGVCVIGIVLLFIGFSQAEAIDRLLASGGEADLRFHIWGPIAEMGWKYFPAGSGIGSFVEVYQIDEPYARLSINYTNHAHNDWLEVYMTGGLLATLLLAIAVGAWGRCTYLAWCVRGELIQGALARLGSVVLFMLALASVGDYPLRTPSMMCLFVITALWLGAAPQLARHPGASESAHSDREPVLPA